MGGGGATTFCVCKVLWPVILPGLFNNVNKGTFHKPCGQVCGIVMQLILRNPTFMVKLHVTTDLKVLNGSCRPHKDRVP